MIHLVPFIVHYVQQTFLYAIHDFSSHNSVVHFGYPLVLFGLWSAVLSPDWNSGTISGCWLWSVWHRDLFHVELSVTVLRISGNASIFRTLQFALFCHVDVSFKFSIPNFANRIS